MAGCGFRRLTVNRERIGCLFADLPTQSDDLLPKRINDLGQAKCGLHIVIRERLGELLIPAFDCLDLIRSQRFDDFIGIIGHTGIAGEEMIDLRFRLALRPDGDTLRGRIIPMTAVCLQLRDGIALPAGTDEGVAADELRSEPRDKTTAENSIQPQGDLRKLHGDRVQVDTVDVAVGNIHFDTLQLVKTLFIGNGLAELLLLAGDIGLGKLVDCLV